MLCVMWYKEEQNSEAQCAQYLTWHVLSSMGPGGGVPMLFIISKQTFMCCSL